MKKALLVLLFFPLALSLTAQTAVTLNLPSGCLITDVDDSQKLELFVAPNPSNSIFRLSIKGNNPIGKAMVRIFTAQGTLIFDEQLYSESQIIDRTISTEHLSSGLYVVVVQGNGDILTTNIVLNK